MTCEELDNAIAYYSGQLGNLNAQISDLASQISAAEVSVKAQDDLLGTSGGPAVSIPMNTTMINNRITWLGYVASMMGSPANVPVLYVVTGYQSILTMMNDKANLTVQRDAAQGHINECLAAKQAQGCP